MSMTGSTLLALWLSAGSAAPLADDGTTELRYTGSLAQLAPGGGRTPVKQFDVYCLVETGTAEALSATFVVSEDGGSGIPWPERFGRRSFAADAAVAAGRSVRLLHSYLGRQYPIELPLPVFEHRRRLAADADWEQGPLRYDVARSRQVGDHDCWQVEVTGQAGRSQTLNVEKQSGVIVSGTRRLIMGQGDVFELTYQLESAKPLTADAAARVRRPAETLLKLQETLGRAPDETRPQLAQAQLAATAEVLADLARDAESTPFARLAAVIGRDVLAQQQRAKSIEELAKRLIGQTAPDFSLTDLDDRAVDPAARAGKVVVLHFWGYQDEPLEEPYGQVGYLDFLLTRHHGEGLVVYGVASHPRLRDRASAAAAKRSIRKLTGFMNLGYDVTLDGTGNALKAFGDPTQFDAELPLWVVIGRDGKLAHYKTGFYTVSRDKGLEELDAVVTGLLGK